MFRSMGTDMYVKIYGYTTFVAHTTHTGTSFAGITHSNSLGRWFLDSGATNHITGNKTCFLFHIYLWLFTFHYHG